MLLADGVPPSRAVTVHEGIDVDHVLAAPPVNVHEAFWLPHHAPVVGNVAALVPHKGQRYLIEAAHLVVQEVPDARFVILGEGELREPLERQVREHHLEKHVLLPGFRTDVLGCIKGFDLFVMSSVTEGLGTSLLDAMACSQADRRHRSRRHSRSRRATGVTGSARAAARHRGAWRGAIIDAAERRTARRQMGEAGFARVSAALHRRADGRRDRRRVRARGRHTPRSGHCESRCGALEAARVHHAQVAQREVVLHRILRVEAAKRRRDVARHRPARARVARQTQTAADADDVRVERHDELGRGHA